MTVHAVLVPNKIKATDVDALNRTAVGTTSIDNGNIFELLTYSSTTGQGEVWTATVASAITNLWMAYSPEVVEVAGANQRLRPKNDARRLQEGDDPARRLSERLHAQQHH